MKLTRMKNAVVFGFIGLWAWGCASAPETNVSFNSDSALSPGKNLPIRPQEYHRQQTGFAGQLPLGISGRFDLVLSDTADDVSSFYNSYVRPLRSGKIFARTPYQMDYSVLPSRGQAFSSNRDALGMKTVNIRSDYKLQVGVTRRFSNFGDFLNPQFWTASGEFAPSMPQQTTQPLPLIDTLGDPNYDWQNQPEAPFDIEALSKEHAAQQLLEPAP